MFQRNGADVLCEVPFTFAQLALGDEVEIPTLRGRAKVDGQWKLYCLVHNIEKLAHAGYAA